MPSKPIPPEALPVGSEFPTPGGPSFVPDPMGITRRGVEVILIGAVLTLAWLALAGAMLDPFHPLGFPGCSVTPTTTQFIKGHLPYHAALPFLRIVPLFGAVLLTAAPREMRGDRLGLVMIALLLAQLATRAAFDPWPQESVADSEPMYLWLSIGQAVALAVWGARIARGMASGAPANGDKWRRIGLSMVVLAVAIPIVAAIYDLPPLLALLIPSHRVAESVATLIADLADWLRFVGAIGIGVCLLGLVLSVGQFLYELKSLPSNFAAGGTISEERPARMATVGLAMALTVLAIHAASGVIDTYRRLESAQRFEELKHLVPASLAPSTPARPIPTPQGGR